MKDDTAEKPQLSGVEYVAELNRRLQVHPGFVQGMAFFLHTDPEGDRGEWTIGWAGPGEREGWAHQIEREVDQAYDKRMQLDTHDLSQCGHLPSAMLNDPGVVADG